MNRSGHFPKQRLQRRSRSSLFASFAILATLFFFPAPIRAQVNSNNAPVNLVAIRGTSIGIAAAPGTVNFNLLPGGVGNGSSAITVTTDWNLRPSMGTVTLYAYFSSAPAALTNGAGSNIPSANVFGSPNAGAFTPFTGNSPFAAGSSVTIYAQKVTGNSRQVLRNDTLALRVNLAGLTLPSGTYTGILHFRGQVL
jgi:hypothetical protein